MKWVHFLHCIWFLKSRMIMPISIDGFLHFTFWELPYENYSQHTTVIMLFCFTWAGPWLVLEYHSLLVTVAGSNGAGGDHPIPAVVRRYCCYWCGKLLVHCLLGCICIICTHSLVKIYCICFRAFCHIPLLLWLAGLLMLDSEDMKLLILLRLWPLFIASILYFFTMLTGGGDFYTEYRVVV